MEYAALVEQSNQKGGTVSFSGLIPKYFDEIIKEYQDVFKARYPTKKRPNKQELIWLFMLEGKTAFQDRIDSHLEAIEFAKNNTFM